MVKDYSGGIKVDASILTSGLYKFKEKTREMAEFFMSDGAVELEKYMKENAPWRDRTGLARASLSAKVSSKNISRGRSMITIELESPVMYGEALEKGTNHSAPYPIVEPTLRLKAPQVINNLYDLLEREKSMFW